MAKVCVSSSGSNTSPYDTWAKAANLVQTGLSAASAGDIVQIDRATIHTDDKEVSTTTTWLVTDGSTVVFGDKGVDPDTADFTYAPCGTTYWLGHSTIGRILSFNCGSATGEGKARVLGLTLKQGGSSSTTINGSAYSPDMELEDFTFWCTATGTQGALRVGTGNNNSNTTLKNPTLRWDRPLSSMAGLTEHSGKVEIFGGSFVFTAGACAYGLLQTYNGSAGTTAVALYGTDLSGIGSGCTIIRDYGRCTATVTFDRCKMPSSYSLIYNAEPNQSSVHVYTRDCHSGDTHMAFEYANGLGTVTKDTGTYLTAGPAGASWRIDTTAYAAQCAPFTTPWMHVFKAAGSFTPEIEILRNNGTASAYSDADVWGEWLTKETSGYVTATLTSDRETDPTDTTGTPQADGAGDSNWTIASSNSPFDMKLSPGARTLAEDGYVSGRVCFGVASATIYVDPNL